MANGIDIDIPCPKVPKIPKIPDINIMGMLNMKGFLDFSVGSPRDCTLAINLMIQLAPLMASMTCLLKILAVIKAMEEFVKSPLTETKDLLEKIGDVASCFVALNPPSIAITIKGVLELIINFLNCFIENLKSLLTFQASIDLSSAEGNPVLKASLECALENSQNSMDNLMMSLEPLKPLLDMSTSVAGVVGIPLELPDLNQAINAEDSLTIVEDLEGVIQSLKDVIDSLPLP